MRGVTRFVSFTTSDMNEFLETPKRRDYASPSTPQMSSAQISLSLDHVIEMILRSLNLAQLFECRLLSRQWNSLASVFIRNRVEIIFYDQHSSTRSLNTKSENILYKKLGKLDSLPLYPRSHFPFPVNNFTFYFLDIYNAQVTRFLNIHGRHIEELALQSCLEVGRTEAQLMDFVATLLSKQTRNLEILRLCVRATDIQWKNDMSPNIEYTRPFYFDDSAAPMLPNDPEFFEIYSRFQYENPESKLRVFQIDSQISAKIFEVIYRMSPKLEEIIVDSHYARFLATPVNRAHVFKTLCSSWWSCYFSDDVMLKFLESLNIKDRLKLRTIVLRREDVSDSFQIENGWKNLVDAINYLFKISCDSIESLGWINLRFLKEEGVKWCPMLKLKKLTIGRYAEPGYCFPIPPRHIFPPGFSPAKLFPQLETVQLCVHNKYAGNLFNFLNSLNFEPVRSVRVVDVRDDSPGAIITSEHVRFIKNLFPLARIVTGRTCARYPLFCCPSHC